MHVTNGRILLNSRYMNINGYDCFINLENVVNGDLEDGSWDTHDNWVTPMPGVEQKIFCGEKCISPKTLAVQNIFGVEFPYSNISLSSQSDFTLAYWGRYKSLHPENHHSFGIIFSSFPNYWPNLWDQYRPHQGSLIDTTAIQITTKENKFDYDFESNTWYHIMISKKGTDVYVFINGDLILTFSQTDSISNSSPWNVELRGIRALCEYDDIVVVQGECLATESFSLPTDYLLDKKYNTTLTYNNIIYPLTIGERKAILPSSIPIQEMDPNILKVY